MAAVPKFLGDPTMVATFEAVGVGPGLYTGMRVGITTAQTLAHARRLPVVGLASLDLLLRSRVDSVHSLAELRYWLEGIGARQAVARADEAQVAEIEEAFDRLHASAGRASVWIATDTMFHAALVRAADNAYLTPLYESVHAALVSVTYEKWVEQDVVPSWLSGDSWGAQLELHRPIVDALRRRDQAALEVALDAHHQAILDHLEHRDGGNSATRAP